ncbi:uncharacterized protein MYCGRDRAFT_69290 [Zymoseptoria tritici IPO323]|uniref:tRNA (guanine(26)-N(2))-dimethyltransferase n=1 Tax=Zymoseptoria tritici (strain CBS 115943 / IPO323) TaxID=336722 RepID=F9X627_ZYMTI|nr:uncharacterized protein MYCGRDRAFT_69290 [Zymoseptoria tritici IPO323]EGP88635.1 hypothetical protein MYCGRDRAFT_69290 [Zymoseptoria tritici IPO323]
MATISSKPAAGQMIEHEGNNYDTVREGQAYILIPPNTQIHVNPQAKAAKAGEHFQYCKDSAQSVFYNPIQQFNRDLSVLSIKAFGEDWLKKKLVSNERSKARGERRRSKKRKVADTKDGEAGDEDEIAQNAAKQGNGHAETTQNGQSTTPAGPKFRILDALSATGLRALRYAQEIPLNTSIVANDMNPNAIKSMKLNVEHNKLSSSITPNLGDAIGHMYQVAYPPTNSHGPQHVSRKYDVIDLDPYGSAAPFIDAALQALNDGGLLCVTCTDAGVWASTGYCEKTYALYGGMPIKGPHMHEGGLRLIISSIASAAARHGLAIEPLLSLNIDFYARVFIRVQRSAADVKFLAGKTMLVYGCDHGCGAWNTNMLGRNTKQTSKNSAFHFKHTIAQAPSADRLCDHCKSKTHIAGPMWGGPIHNAAFIEKILSDLSSADSEVYQTTPRIEGMLSTALDELSVNEDPLPHRFESSEIIPKIPAETIDSFPFFFNVSTLSKVLHCIAPGDAAIKGALRHAGYHITRSHCQPGSIKTNASWAVIWEVMREWVRQRSPIKEGKLKEGTAGWEIMKKARKEDVPEENGKEKVPGETPEIAVDVEPRRKVPGEVGRTFRVVFDEALGRDPERDSRLKGGRKVVRYQMNPRENWGPMTKAKGSA